MLKIEQAELIQSTVSVNEAIKTGLPEFVMIGRSNVGKSSFINTLCNRKKLAYISKTPGKTRLINLYQINKDLVLTDLPGYGFAKRSQKEQQFWQKKLEQYLTQREEIVAALHLIDSRHDIQKNDLQMREWLLFHNIPTYTLLTKVDLINKGHIKGKIDQTKKILDENVFGFSAKNKYGKDEVLKLITELMKKN